MTPSKPPAGFSSRLVGVCPGAVRTSESMMVAPPKEMPNRPMRSAAAHGWARTHSAATITSPAVARGSNPPVRTVDPEASRPWYMSTKTVAKPRSTKPFMMSA